MAREIQLTTSNQYKADERSRVITFMMAKYLHREMSSNQLAECFFYYFVLVREGYDLLYSKLMNVSSMVLSVDILVDVLILAEPRRSLYPVSIFYECNCFIILYRSIAMLGTGKGSTAFSLEGTLSRGTPVVTDIFS